MALGEDQLVVRRVLRIVEVVAEVLRAASTAIRSAADIPEVGWPDFATAAGRIESTRNCWPSSRGARSPPSPAIVGGRRRRLSPVGYGPVVKVAVAFDHRGVQLRDAMLDALAGHSRRRPGHRHGCRTDRLPGQGARDRRGHPRRRRRARGARLRLRRRRLGRRVQAAPGSAPRSATTSIPRTRASSTTT